MKKRIALFLLITALGACQNAHPEKKAGKQDSVTSTTDNGPAAMKAFMDSLVKANGGQSLNISVSGAEGAEQAGERKILRFSLF